LHQQLMMCFDNYLDECELVNDKLVLIDKTSSLFIRALALKDLENYVNLTLHHCFNAIQDFCPLILISIQ